MLHDILNARKKELGMDIESIVERSGVPKGTVSKIMSGITPNPSIENVKAIAHALGLTLSDLDERISEQDFSDEERSLIRAFRSLDASGKAVMQAVLETQQQRIRECGPAVKLQSVEIVRKRIPMIQGTHEAEIQMRYQSQQEQRELEQSETLEPTET